MLSAERLEFVTVDVDVNVDTFKLTCTITGHAMINVKLTMETCTITGLALILRRLRQRTATRRHHPLALHVIVMMMMITHDTHGLPFLTHAMPAHVNTGLWRLPQFGRHVARRAQQSSVALMEWQRSRLAVLVCYSKNINGCKSGKIGFDLCSYSARVLL